MNDGISTRNLDVFTHFFKMEFLHKNFQICCQKFQTSIEYFQIDRIG